MSRVIVEAAGETLALDYTLPPPGPAVPTGYRLLKDFDLTRDEGWTKRTGKTNSAAYNNPAAVTFTPHGLDITTSRRAKPITASGFQLTLDTGEAMAQHASMILPNYFYARATWQATAFHEGLWWAAWFRPFGGGEGEIDWLESFGGHTAGAIDEDRRDHGVTLIKTPYGTTQKNYGLDFDYSRVGDDWQGITRPHVYEIQKEPGRVRTWCDGVLMSTHTRGKGMTTAEWDANFEQPAQRWYFRFTSQTGDDPDGNPVGMAGPVPAGFTAATFTLSSLLFAVPA